MIGMRIEMIGPDRAIELLENNKTNRPISKNQVLRYADMMRAGQWQLTPQGITVSENGNLLDGQTRLSAIKVTGLTLPFCVFTMPGHENAMGVIFDRGKTRSAMEITGISKDSCEVSNFILREILSGSSKIEPLQTQDFHRKHYRAFGWYESNITQSHTRALSVAAIRAALVVRYMGGVDWSDQYRALVALDYSSMNPGTQVLCRYLAKKEIHGGIQRVNIFALAYRVSGPAGQTLTRCPPCLDIGDARETVLHDEVAQASA